MVRPARAAGVVTSEKLQATGSQLTARVLVAEDGQDNQALIQHYLKKAGAEVVIVEDGQAAVEAVTEAGRNGKRFDLVLMDMQMPVMDGYAAARRLRELGFTAPIVALTAHAMEGDRERCLEAGCGAFVAKPIDRQELLETIRACLGEGRGAVRPAA